MAEPEPEHGSGEDFKDASFSEDVAAEFEKINTEMSDASKSGSEKVVEEKQAQLRQFMIDHISKSIPKEFRNPENTQKIANMVDDLGKTSTTAGGLDVMQKSGMWESAKSGAQTVGKALAWPVEKIYDGLKATCDWFKTPEGKIKSQLNESARDKLNNLASDPNATDAEKSKALAEYEKTKNGVTEGVNNDVKGDEEGKSKWGEPLWKILKLLLCIGGFFGALGLMAHQLNGCYQYSLNMTDTTKNKDPVQLMSCKDFYNTGDNKTFCSCGTPANPLVCDANNTNNPYCKCTEAIGVVCNMDSKDKKIYYSYNDTHSVWSILGNVAGEIAKIFDGLPDEVGGLWDWIKKNFKIVLIIGGVLFGLWLLKLIVEAYNTTKHLVHDLSSGETSEVTKK